MRDSDGVSASRLQLPPGPWETLLDGLCARFPSVSRDTWRDRFARGRVLDASGAPLAGDARYRVGAQVRYFREVVDEAPVPFVETVLYADAHLMIVDKPHFLSVTPAGVHASETLLARLVRRFENPDLVPLHRIDRHTAGLVMFSTNPATRGAYHRLFRERLIHKRYEAIAPPLPELSFPCIRSSRLVAGEPFFRMQEIDGPPNSQTQVEVMERAGDSWRYALMPTTGKKHQLRVHMAALGAPIRGDRLYPRLREQRADDYTQPLQLLARELAFIDPLNGLSRRYETTLSLSLRDRSQQSTAD